MRTLPSTFTQRITHRLSPLITYYLPALRLYYLLRCGCGLPGITVVPECGPPGPDLPPLCVNRNKQGRGRILPPLLCLGTEQNSDRRTVVEQQSRHLLLPYRLKTSG